MPQISATHLARHMSEILDGVEHRGETYTVVRHGRPVARIGAAPRPDARALREYFEHKPPVDDELGEDLERALRDARSLPARVVDPWDG